MRGWTVDGTVDAAGCGVHLSRRLGSGTFSILRNCNLAPSRTVGLFLRRITRAGDVPLSFSCRAVPDAGALRSNSR